MTPSHTANAVPIGSSGESSPAAEPVLSVRNLSVTFPSEAGSVHAVRGVDFDLMPGRTLAIVGESGSGKSVTSLAVMGLLPGYAKVEGSVVYAGTELIGKSDKEMSQIRGKDISMIFQDPLSSLTPVFSIGDQLIEAIQTHRDVSKREAEKEAIRLLKLVGIPEAEKRVKSFPHEFSGGMRQRVVIAIAMANNPRVIIADEPTTALDVTVQAEILDLLRDVRDHFGTSIILITHNMGVVADLADSVAVMHHGRIVERATATELFADPREEYTQKLLAAVPHLGRDSAWNALEPAAQQALEEAEPLVVARDLVVEYPGRLGRAPFRAVKGVDLTIRRGEVYGLVGESGSGKTTIGRAIAGLTRATGGSLSVFGHEMVGFKEKKFRPVRKRIGFVFQDPAASFNPHLSIGECVAEPLHVHRPELSDADRKQATYELLEAVQLPRDYAARFPHELSGGQRQRASLARGIALDPELLIADEPTSALDVSVQARVLELFKELQERFHYAALFISHDLAVVDMLSDRIGVLFKGQLLEEGTGEQVLRNPRHDYTRRLIASLPVPDPVEQAKRREVARTLR